MDGVSEAAELECLGAERLDHADREDRLLEPGGQVGKRRKLAGGESPDRTPHQAADTVVHDRRSEGGEDEHWAGPHEQVPVERQQQRGRQHGADDGLESDRGGVRIVPQPGNQLARPLATEEAH